MNALFCLCHLFDRALSHDSFQREQRKVQRCIALVSADQPALPRSLIRVFGGRSMDSQGSNFSSGGKLRL